AVGQGKAAGPRDRVAAQRVRRVGGGGLVKDGNQRRVAAVDLDRAQDRIGDARQSTSENAINMDYVTAAPSVDGRLHPVRRRDNIDFVGAGALGIDNEVADIGKSDLPESLVGKEVLHDQPAGNAGSVVQDERSMARHPIDGDETLDVDIPKAVRAV